MGIQGLLPFLDKSSRPVNVSQFKGACAAIDAYCWLHKGAYTCAEKLARGESCDAYVHYCMKYVNMLLSHNIKPILVFDGRHLPAKAGTEKKRRESREANRKRGAELLRAGRPDEARNFLRRCVDVTHEMALNLIRECRRRNVDCIVAPYEADAQLAYLNLKDIAQLVITEDSDLVLFGCKKIMFKMDLHGNGVLVEQERLHTAMGVRPEHFSFDKFRYMCILSGCDYLPSLPGIGLAKACKFITKVSDPDIHKALARLPLFLNMRQLPMTSEYRDDFLRADATFRYQLVYDPLARGLFPLTSPPPDYKPAEFAGKHLPSDVAYQLALGNLDPFSLKEMDTYDPEKSQMSSQGGRTAAWEQKAVAPHPSVWSRGFKVRHPAPAPDPRALDRPRTRGKEVSVASGKVAAIAPPDVSPSDADLASLYGHVASPSSKRPRSPSAGTTPAKRRPSIATLSPKVAVEGSDIQTDQSPIETSSDRDPAVTGTISQDKPTARRVENGPAEKRLSVSPIIGRQTRNPFLKKSSTIKPKTLSFDADEPGNKFSALAKFGKIRATSDGQRRVQSRYFNKTESVTSSVTSSFEEPLHELTNTTALETREMVPPVDSAEELKTSVLSPSSGETDGKEPSRRNAPQTFKWGSLRDKFGHSDVRRRVLPQSTAASCKSFRPHSAAVDLAASDLRRRLAEEEIDDPGVPCTWVDSGVDSVPRVKVDDSEVETILRTQVDGGVDSIPHTQVDSDVDSIPGTQVDSGVDSFPCTQVDSEVDSIPCTQDSGVDSFPCTQVDSKVDSIPCTQVESGVEFVSSSRVVSIAASQENRYKVSAQRNGVNLLKTKTVRRVGLSKIVNMKRNDSQKQQSLLSMFGFQAKTSKFQYRQTL